MYISPDKWLLPDDYELQYIRAIDKTVSIFTGVVLVGVGLFPWFALASLL